MRQEQSCLAIAVEDGQTKCIFDSLNAEQILSQWDFTSALIRSEPNQTNQRLAKVLLRENSMVILCSKFSMLQQKAESSRMSMLAKVLLRENSLVLLGGAELQTIQQVIKNVNSLIL